MFFRVENYIIHPSNVQHAYKQITPNMNLVVLDSIPYIDSTNDPHLIAIYFTCNGIVYFFLDPFLFGIPLEFLFQINLNLLLCHMPFVKCSKCPTCVKDILKSIRPRQVHPHIKVYIIIWLHSFKAKSKGLIIKRSMKPITLIQVRPTNQK